MAAAAEGEASQAELLRICGNLGYALRRCRRSTLLTGHRGQTVQEAITAALQLVEERIVQLPRPPLARRRGLSLLAALASAPPTKPSASQTNVPAACAPVPPSPQTEGTPSSQPVVSPIVLATVPPTQSHFPPLKESDDMIDATRQVLLPPLLPSIPPQQFYGDEPEAEDQPWLGLAQPFELSPTAPVFVPSLQNPEVCPSQAPGHPLQEVYRSMEQSWRIHRWHHPPPLSTSSCPSVGSSETFVYPALAADDIPDRPPFVAIGTAVMFEPQPVYTIPEAPAREEWRHTIGTNYAIDAVEDLQASKAREIAIDVLASRPSPATMPPPTPPMPLDAEHQDTSSPSSSQTTMPTSCYQEIHEYLLREWISEEDGYQGLEVSDGTNKFDIDILRCTTGEYRTMLQARAATAPTYFVMNLDRPDLLRARCGGDLVNVAKAICNEFRISGLLVLAHLPEGTCASFKARIKNLKRKANRTAAKDHTK